ncbi:MAG: tRNA uridine-5-carboxymethylaminomethyl(34) synthesis enzyme MnmG [Cyanobacteria bacterium P01_H01_bin.74]
MTTQPAIDTIVIGAGHAGIEAAMASARLGCSTMLITLNLDTIGQMSCNPAIGGPAKSQLVKEIDALGGVMGLCADATYIQLKTLNSSKGPAVRALRAQSDKAEYRTYCRKLIESMPNIKLRQTMVTEIITEVIPAEGIAGAVGNSSLESNSEIRQLIGVKDNLGLTYYAKSLIITTGTFLNGKLWVGEQSMGGGRPGESGSFGITGSLIELGLKTGRLKTGTPPRIDGRTIDTNKLDKHPGDSIPSYFSFLPNRPVKPQLPCYLTRTNAKTHALIEKHLHRSPMYTGLLHGPGPRYCPSIEDKVTRFPDKDSHHLFVEPEGRNTYEVYLQGFSTCLPYDVQQAMVNTLPGLENAEIIRPACAVEYDYFPAYQLHHSLMSKKAAGIFLAGQINGTSGYEEAAAQGLIAGINATRFIRQQAPLVLSRQSSYIGTLIDDLVTKEISEPYRMLTSRSEFRLLLRQDNADQRLTPIGREIGLVDDERWAVFVEKNQAIATEQARLKAVCVNPTEAINTILQTHCNEQVHEKTSLYQLLRRPPIRYDIIEHFDETSKQLPASVKTYVETEIKYEGYLKRQAQSVKKLSEAGNVKLPVNFDYGAIAQLSNEAKEKLAQLQPTTLGQAAKIPGLTPADIGILQILLTRKKQRAIQTSESSKGLQALPDQV